MSKNKLRGTSGTKLPNRYQEIWKPSPVSTSFWSKDFLFYEWWISFIHSTNIISAKMNIIKNYGIAELLQSQEPICYFLRHKDKKKKTLVSEWYLWIRFLRPVWFPFMESICNMQGTWGDFSKSSSEIQKIARKLTKEI